MTNNIQKVIEEGLKEVINPFAYVQFPAHCVRFEAIDSSGTRFSGRTVNIESEINQIISNVLQAIEEEVEGKLRERPINHMNDIITAFLEKETMSEEEKQHIRNKDNGFYIKNVEYVIHNNALSDVLTLLKSARESIK